MSHTLVYSGPDVSVYRYQHFGEGVINIKTPRGDRFFVSGDINVFMKHAHLYVSHVYSCQIPEAQYAIEKSTEAMHAIKLCVERFRIMGCDVTVDETDYSNVDEHVLREYINEKLAEAEAIRIASTQQSGRMGKLESAWKSVSEWVGSFLRKNRRAR